MPGDRADLVGADLAGSNLGRAKLVSANLARADLSQRYPGVCRRGRSVGRLADRPPSLRGGRGCYAGAMSRELRTYTFTAAVEPADEGMWHAYCPPCRPTAPPPGAPRARRCSPTSARWPG